LGARIEALESAAAQDDTERHITTMRREIAALTLGVRAADERAEALERRPPRPEPTTVARVDELAAELRECRVAIESWQARIEEQSRTVREAQELAEVMDAKAAAMVVAHHATAEAQRVAEGNLRGLLQELRWDTFLVARQHDWAALAAGNEVRDRATADAANRLTEEVDAVRGATERLEAVHEETAEEIRLLRQSVVRSLDTLRDALVTAGGLVESGVPYDERSDVLEERQKALRRALRARRTAPEP
jgi:hypothetical protein